MAQHVDDEIADAAYGVPSPESVEDDPEEEQLRREEYARRLEAARNAQMAADFMAAFARPPHEGWEEEEAERQRVWEEEEAARQAERAAEAESAPVQALPAEEEVMEAEDATQGVEGAVSSEEEGTSGVEDEPAPQLEPSLNAELFGESVPEPQEALTPDDGDVVAESAAAAQNLDRRDSLFDHHDEAPQSLPPPAASKPPALSLPPPSAIIRRPAPAAPAVIPEIPAPVQQAEAGQPPAYPGATVPGTPAEQATAPPPQDVEDVEMPAPQAEEAAMPGQQLDGLLSEEELQAFLDSFQGDGQGMEMLLPEGPALQPQAPVLDFPQAQQEHYLPALAPTAPAPMEMPQHIPIPPPQHPQPMVFDPAAPPPAPQHPFPSGAETEQHTHALLAARTWDRWNPFAFLHPGYISWARMPYDARRASDVLAYMHAGIHAAHALGACTDAALHWIEQAWRGIREVVHADAHLLDQVDAALWRNLPAYQHRLWPGGLLDVLHNPHAAWQVDEAYAVGRALKALRRRQQQQAGPAMMVSQQYPAVPPMMAVSQDLFAAPVPMQQQYGMGMLPQQQQQQWEQDPAAAFPQRQQYQLAPPMMGQGQYGMEMVPQQQGPAGTLAPAGATRAAPIEID